MKFRKSVMSLILAALVMVAGRAGSARAQGPTPFPNCRLGGAGAFTPFVGDYDIAQLNIGRYIDWWNNADPTSNLGLPAGIQYVQTVRVHQDKGNEWYGPPLEYASNTYKVRPSLTTLASLAASQPGSLWLIGNEVERPDWWEATGWSGQDEITPELYATAFHEIRDAIKTADPTAMIGMGSVIEGTPLRFAYLDRVWDSYLSQYGHRMGDDIDAWNVHGFLLREVRNSWGAEVPAGFDNEDADPDNDFNPGDGFLYGADTATIVAEHRNILRFQEFTLAFREWMAMHGERNKPLLNTEYGILYKNLSGYQITPQQVNDYLIASFDYLFTATDAEVGDPLDENRLVQGWFWYSLNDNYWNGNLFDPNTHALTGFGTTWKNYVSNPAHPLASQPQPNLLVTNLRTDPDPVVVTPGGSTTVKLLADVANSGNTRTSTANHLAVSFWDGDPDNPGSHQIGSTQFLNDLPGCGRFTTVEVDWPDRTAGEYHWYVRVAPVAGEVNLVDNTADSLVSVLGQLPDADLEAVKGVDNATPYAGLGRVTYTVRVINHGPDPVTDVVVDDPLPSGLHFESSTATQGVYHITGEWTVGALSNGAQAILTLTARVDSGQAGKTITNSATVSAPRNDSAPANDTASVDIVPLPVKKIYLPAIFAGS